MTIAQKLIVLFWLAVVFAAGIYPRVEPHVHHLATSDGWPRDEYRVYGGRTLLYAPEGYYDNVQQVYAVYRVDAAAMGIEWGLASATALALIAVTRRTRRPNY